MNYNVFGGMFRMVKNTTYLKATLVNFELDINCSVCDC